MSMHKEHASSPVVGSRLNSIVGPLLIISALGFVVLLAAGANLAGALIGMLPLA
jgi:hypothetical protein